MTPIDGGDTKDKPEQLPDPQAVAAAFQKAFASRETRDTKSVRGDFERLVRLAKYVGEVYGFLPSPYAFPSPTLSPKVTPAKLAEHDVVVVVGDRPVGAKLFSRAALSESELAPLYRVGELGEPVAVAAAIYIGISEDGKLLLIGEFPPVGSEDSSYTGEILTDAAHLPMHLTAWDAMFEGSHNGIPVSSNYPLDDSDADAEGCHTARLKVRASGQTAVIERLCHRIEVAVRSMQRHLVALERDLSGFTRPKRPPKKKRSP